MSIVPAICDTQQRDQYYPTDPIKSLLREQLYPVKKTFSSFWFIVNMNLHFCDPMFAS